MKKTKSSSIAITFLSFFISGAVQAEKVINFAHALPAQSHFSVGVDAFKETLERLSDNEFRVVQHSGGALGGERALIEGLQFGTVDAVLTSTGPLGNFVPEVLVFDLPFLFRDYDHARCVLDGDVGHDMLEVISSRGGVRALGWSESGFRHVTNSVRSIHEPSDMENMKIRTMENQVHMDTFRALDADPTPMAFPELFTALQQGTVDGQENPITVISSSRFSEVQEYLSMTGHSYTGGVIMLSNSVYDGLDEKQKSWVNEAVSSAIKATRDEISHMEEVGLVQLQNEGVEVEKNIDREAFRSSVEEIYDEFSEKNGSELIDRIESSGC